MVAVAVGLGLKLRLRRRDGVMGFWEGWFRGGVGFRGGVVVVLVIVLVDDVDSGSGGGGGVRRVIGDAVAVVAVIPVSITIGVRVRA